MQPGLVLPYAIGPVAVAALLLGSLGSSQPAMRLFATALGLTAPPFKKAIISAISGAPGANSDQDPPAWSKLAQQNTASMLANNCNFILLVVLIFVVFIVVAAIHSRICPGALLPSRSAILAFHFLHGLAECVLPLGNRK